MIARASGESPIDEALLVEAANSEPFDEFARTVKRHQQDVADDDGQALLDRQRNNRKARIPTIEGRLGYLGPLGMPTPPKVKLDLTADEVTVRRLDPRPVIHPFSDAPSSPAAGHLAHVVCYSLPELLGEKIRALARELHPPLPRRVLIRCRSPGASANLVSTKRTDL